MTLGVTLWVTMGVTLVVTLVVTLTVDVVQDDVLLYDVERFLRFLLHRLQATGAVRHRKLRPASHDTQREREGRGRGGVFYKVLAKPIDNKASH